MANPTAGMKLRRPFRTSRLCLAIPLILGSIAFLSIIFDDGQNANLLRAKRHAAPFEGQIDRRRAFLGFQCHNRSIHWVYLNENIIEGIRQWVVAKLMGQYRTAANSLMICSRWNNEDVVPYFYIYSVRNGPQWGIFHFPFRSCLYVHCIGHCLRWILRAFTWSHFCYFN